MQTRTTYQPGETLKRALFIAAITLTMGAGVAAAISLIIPSPTRAEVIHKRVEYGAGGERHVVTDPHGNTVAPLPRSRSGGKIILYLPEPERGCRAIGNGPIICAPHGGER